MQQVPTSEHLLPKGESEEDESDWSATFIFFFIQSKSVVHLKSFQGRVQTSDETFGQLGRRGEIYETAAR